MKRAEWMKDFMMGDEISPLGTPQFNISKAGNFKAESGTSEAFLTSSDRHKDAIVLADISLEKSREFTQNPEKTSAPANELIEIQNLFEASISKIRKQYLQKERKLFEQIKNEEEIHLLIATRPEILEIPAKISVSPLLTPGPHYIDDYSQHLQNSKRSNKTDSFNLMSFDLFGESESSKKGKVSENLFESTLHIQEREIRRKFYEVYKEKEKKLIEMHEKQLEEAVMENEEDWEGYWKERIDELNGMISEFTSRDESERIQREQEEIYENRRISELRGLEGEIESKVKSEYLQKKSKVKFPQLTIRERDKKILKLQAEIEILQMNELNQEKSYWERELVNEAIEKSKNKLKNEQEMVLMRKEKELKNQVNGEINEVVSRLIEETSEAVEKRLEKILQDQEFIETEMKEEIKSECFQEIRKENEAKFREAAWARMKTSFEKDLKKNLASRIEMEVKIRLEDKIYQELNQEFEISHENFRKKIESENYSKSLALEEQFESTLSQQVSIASEKTLSRIEKDLKINYLKRQDKLKSDLRKEFEEIFIGQIKVFFN